MADRSARYRFALACARRALYVLAWAVASAGCALQLAPSVHLPNHHRYVRAVELGFRYKPARRHGMYGALDGTFADATRAATFSLREVALGAGYHVGLGPVSLELGPRLGLGQPAFVALRGTAFHSALELAALFRVVGRNEERPGFIPFELKVDVFAFARGGVWARPAGDDGQAIWDAAFGLGIRCGVASDLTGSDDAWEAR